MSKNKRRIELIYCSCTVDISESGEINSNIDKTVHVENKDGEMRCIICGNIKKERCVDINEFGDVLKK